MHLNEDQKNEVRQWVTQGVHLPDIQERLQKDFDLSLTYMEVRFLIDDLGAEMPVPVIEEVEKVEASDPDILDEGTVSLDLDAVQRPGVSVSGSVTFSDGIEAQWQIDSMGQLGVIPKGQDKDYRPSDEDIQEFQKQLQEQLKQKRSL